MDYSTSRISFLGGFGLITLNMMGNSEIWFACGLFFFNHLYSFLYYRDRTVNSPEQIQGIVHHPYTRIIPMHLTIIFGGFLTLAFSSMGKDPGPIILLLFLGLKTYVDLRMHTAKHTHGKVNYF
ncbi:MAG: DUF6498-containing protein [Methanomicrobiales archaeon]|nr:DUF6498-containing protein [Methanomicrobiales archaeon]